MTSGPGLAAACVFALTFAVLAIGRWGSRAIPRGPAALLGGALTLLVLVPTGHVSARIWDLVDWQVILLLAGLMVLAGLAEAAGLFAGTRGRMHGLGPFWALYLSLVLMAIASALLLNDAAVVVLVPFLIPMLRSCGLRLVPAVVLLAIAANVGSLLTPFGNPQNAVLAAHAHLGVASFIVVQGPLFLVAMALLAIASWWFARGAVSGPDEVEHRAAKGRPWLAACVAAFVVLATVRPRDVGLGTAAAACAVVAYLGLRPALGRRADRAARDGLDWNVITLFLGLYFLTAGLQAWFPTTLHVGSLDTAAKAALATAAISNTVGNVPAMLTFKALDPAWTLQHAHFLVATSTLGGAMLLTGSAASLLAADQARKSGVEVSFVAFLRHAVPWVLPVFVLAAWHTWSVAP